MKTLTRATWLSLAVLVLATDAMPQQPGQVVTPQTPARPTPSRDPRAIKGTAVVKGQLLDALTGNPIRRARVTLSGPGTPNAAGAQTDTEGRFEIREDLNDVLLVGQTGGIARGRVVTDEGSAPPFAPGTIQVIVSPTDPRLPYSSRPPIRPQSQTSSKDSGRIPSF